MERDIKSEFEKLHQRLDVFEGKYSTKDDLKAFATKDDLKAFATKDDLKAFATKDDLKAFATKDDLKAFATKDDLKAQTNELKQFAEEQTEFLAQIIETTVATPLQRHLENSTIHDGLVSRVDSLEQDMRLVKKHLTVK